MGALEFEPSQKTGSGEMSLELDQLYHKAQDILEQREATFRTVADEIGVEGYWIDKIEAHFAEMSPKMLPMLTGYKPLSFDYVIEGEDITVTNLHWTEMGNGV